VESCLERIRALEPSIHAWVQVSPQPATSDGPLSGVPFGVKDIIETRGLATEYGSPLYKGRIGTMDAAIVRDLRHRGAILLGKTQTTAFAYRTPAPTRNPHNLAHTPGGSSSGSAAAVAAGMAAFALGTQTQGSVLRPASYCGVTGFKPSYGLLSMDGVLPFAKSLDTLGLFTRTPMEMLELWEAMGHAIGDGFDGRVAYPTRTPDVEPHMRVAFEQAVERLRETGVPFVPIELADMLASLMTASNIINAYEGARTHERHYAEHGARLEHLADLVRDGLQISDARYADARRHIAECRVSIDTMFEGVIVLPAATGPAPYGLASTGDPRMNAPWTALGMPAISIPLPVEGLPLGLQIVGKVGEDSHLLRAAVWLYRSLHRD
jgi:Asp-tRNA(Asn)/Glu-tRNA(Gln) amidotransferase A subunit family amidase